MSRIKDYPEATSMADDDILVIDGDNGTRKVKKSKFVEIISEHVDDEIEELRQDFQDGVDTIYNAIVAEGVTPSASTPQACAAGIHDITQITWTENFEIEASNEVISTVNWNTASSTISLSNIVKYKMTSDGSASSDKSIKIKYYNNSGREMNVFSPSLNTEYTPPTGAVKMTILVEVRKVYIETITFLITRQAKILR